MLRYRVAQQVVRESDLYTIAGCTGLYRATVQSPDFIMNALTWSVLAAVGEVRGAPG